VAQQVVEYSTRPALVVRAPYSGLKRVLVVTDGSMHSQQALEYLVPPCPEDQPTSEGIRRRCFWLSEAAQVRLMHVLPPPILSDASLRTWAVGPEALYPAPVPPVDSEAIEEEEHRYGERILNEALATLADANLQAETNMPRGDAATEIIEDVKDNQIDLVVCGSRGLNPVTGWLLGSVSRKLVHYAPCSVMIVKGQ
jgi:nucleotide-binding universal stress UspA family protein